MLWVLTKSSASPAESFEPYSIGAFLYLFSIVQSVFRILR